MVRQIICSAEKVVRPLAVPSDIALSCKGLGKNVFFFFFFFFFVREKWTLVGGNVREFRFLRFVRTLSDHEAQIQFQDVILSIRSAECSENLSDK